MKNSGYCLLYPLSHFSADAVQSPKPHPKAVQLPNQLPKLLRRKLPRRQPRLKLILIFPKQKVITCSGMTNSTVMLSTRLSGITNLMSRAGLMRNCRNTQLPPIMFLSVTEILLSRLSNPKRTARTITHQARSLLKIKKILHTEKLLHVLKLLKERDSGLLSG